MTMYIANKITEMIENDPKEFKYISFNQKITNEDFEMMWKIWCVNNENFKNLFGLNSIDSLLYNFIFNYLPMVNINQAIIITLLIHHHSGFFFFSWENQKTLRFRLPDCQIARVTLANKAQ